MLKCNYFPRKSKVLYWERREVFQYNLSSIAFTLALIKATQYTTLRQNVSKISPYSFNTKMQRQTNGEAGHSEGGPSFRPLGNSNSHKLYILCTIYCADYEKKIFKNKNILLGERMNE